MGFKITTVQRLRNRRGPFANNGIAHMKCAHPKGPTTIAKLMAVGWMDRKSGLLTVCSSPFEVQHKSLSSCWFRYLRFRLASGNMP